MSENGLIASLEAEILGQCKNILSKAIKEGTPLFNEGKAEGTIHFYTLKNPKIIKEYKKKATHFGGTHQRNLNVY